MARTRGYLPSAVTLLGGGDPVAIASRAGLTDIDRVAIRSAPGWMVRMWRGNIAAMTLPWAIYVRRDVLGGDPSPLSKLVEHELVHVRQWQQLGTMRFIGRYLRDYLMGRKKGLSHNQAYLAISLEREAREVSGH
jgi:hypothetical protein